ncbi:MAG: ABC transporter ATP-binding protein [Bacilli bacterium]|nr:ABC transporter ATP-binding protein [Bacilli bacterium]
MEIKLSKAYGNVIVFDDFNIEVQDNQLNCIIGPSGCGKTTLLQCIAGLATYEGKIIPTTNKIGYVFQEDRLFPYLTVYKNLEIINANQSIINQYLEEFHVSDLRDKYPSQLSGGEKQRIALIRAFIAESRLILLDEPFKSLDYFLAWSLCEMLVKLYQKTKKTMILVTHNVEMAVYLGQYIHVLSNKPAKVKKTIFNPHAFHKFNEESLSLYNELLNLIKG